MLVRTLHNFGIRAGEQEVALKKCEDKPVVVYERKEVCMENTSHKMVTN